VNISVTMCAEDGTAGYAATDRVLKVTSAIAVLGAELVDDAGRQIARASVVSQSTKDIDRLAG
jgi:hypothetical protein